MKIEKISLPEKVTSLRGLKPIRMEKLGEVVLVAGKNGSGKTRLLQLIKEQVANVPNFGQLVQIKKDLEYNLLLIQQEKETIKRHEIQLADSSLPADQIQPNKNSINNSLRNIKSYEDGMLAQKAQIEMAGFFKLIPDKEENAIIDFVPKSLHLKDSYTISPAELESFSRNIYTVGTTIIADGTIPAIELIQKRWANANTTTTDDLNISNEESIKINDDYARLRQYIKLFLNTELKRNKEGHPEIFNRRIGEANLSDGQKVLLQFCMALYAQEVNLESVVIFMDEPENHLHPASLIEVLEKITPHIKTGQLWIATHSINVLAHFNTSAIWYIDNGEISYAGNVPEKVLAGLLGNEEEIEKLSHFLTLPAQMASYTFAFESLFYPHVLVTGAEDPQVKQIHQIIEQHAQSGKKIKVLDYGIGKGRLLSTIYENERLKKKDLKEWLDLYGFDKDDTNKDICLKVFEKVYESSDNRYFNTPKTILSNHDEGTFDIIVMCNVFHEIDPQEWINSFTSVTSPFRLLKGDGYLLIVEDQFLAIGEKAHSKGFLVYDTLEFKTLFKINEGDGYHSIDHRKDGRLKAHHIPASCIKRIDTESKKLSLEKLLQNSKDRIKELRKLDPTYKNGKLHGFWSQQLANSMLALE